MVSKDSATAELNDLFGVLTVKTTTEYTDFSLEKKKKNIAALIDNLLHLIANDVCHGDIKPRNILQSNSKDILVIMDFAGAINIAEKVELMNRDSRFTSKNHTSDFLPATSREYACTRYIKAICDSFWLCEPDNFRRACNALDIRSSGVTIGEILTAIQPPVNERDGEYYESLRNGLAQKVSEKALSIIMRMAEPMSEERMSAREFPLPVSIQELEELRAEFEQSQE